MTAPFIRGRWSKESWFALLVLVVVSAVAATLYGPYLENPFVFDDGNLFFTPRLTTAAVEPWELLTRSLPYFTLGWVQTQFGTMEAHRLISLVLHILVAWQLYQLLKQLLLLDVGRHEPADRERAYVVAAVLAVVFVAHPAAVYAAGI